MADWQPTARMDTLRKRARLLEQVRGFFRARGLLEVETPVLSAAGVTDPNLHSMAVTHTRPDPSLHERLYLHTSPEFAMKRLLAAGSGPIWQICRVFRAGERGRLHNPEFTMLEWYRPGWDHHRLMDEVADLIRAVCGDRPLVRQTYAELFEPLDIDPHRDPESRLRERATALDIRLPDTPVSGDDLLDLILAVRIAPGLGRGCMHFVHDFPVSQAALSRIRAGENPVAERFECFLDGIEIANGFHELTNAVEQEERFRQDQDTRTRAGRPTPPMDRNLLEALAKGIPACAGVALGLDRLFMVALGAERIDDVIAFPIDRA